MKEHSIFWPLAMITAGVLWLLVGMDIVPGANVWALTHILPYLLIALGLGLILRAYWRFAGMLLSLLVVAGAVMAVIYAPQFGWDKGPDFGWSWNLFDMSPEFGGAVSGSGVVRSETRQVSKFNSIAVEYPAEITILQGKSESVLIKAEDNLIPQLETEVSDGKLTIENTERDWQKRVNPGKPVFITITVVNLEQVDFSSAGTLLIEDLQTDSLKIVVSGAGDITLTKVEAKELIFRLSGAGSVEADGVAEKLEIHISGMGSIDSSDLQVQEAEVRISGAGSATIWVEEKLEANISGAGSIAYFGEPEVIKSISGAGSVNSIGKK